MHVLTIRDGRSKSQIREHGNSKHRSAGEIVIPDKLYFRIGEVAKLCDLPTYVLRFWETEFPMLAPKKSSTGQRLYRQRDVENVVRIKKLLYEEGFTIAGARQQLKTESSLRARKPLFRSWFHLIAGTG